MGMQLASDAAEIFDASERLEALEPIRIRLFTGGFALDNTMK